MFKITEDEIYSTHGRDEKCMQILGRNARDFNVDGKNRMKIDLKYRLSMAQH
jgi:hypothetical protein